jgi:hypothetical protein
MTLKDVLQQFLNDEQWEDEIVHDDGDNTDFINTGFQIDGQRYRLILITAEKIQTIRALLVSPIKIPKPRAKEAASVLNSLNIHICYGNLEMDNEGAVYYRWGIDIEGTTAAPKQFGSLISAATSAFDELRSSAIGAAAFTKQSAQEIIREYKRAVEKSKEEAVEAKVH